MDLKSSNCMIQPHSHGEGVRKLNLKNLAEKDGKRNVVEAPSTPGRPVFSFSVASRKKSVPSKWNDAEKWVNNSEHHHHHQLHCFVKAADFVSNSDGFGVKAKVNNISEEKVSVYHHHNSSDVLKDKFTTEVDPLKFESFVFKESSSRDIGTEMTPLGSSATTRCPTPFKTLSPPRHNTAAATQDDIIHLELAKLKPNWTSMEEEEEDISKSLRHFEINNNNNNECSRKSISSAWGEDDNNCLRYQREEAKIQAWVDLQNAKAEAQSRKLEVKIQKMRSKFEEKLMRKMSIVHRKADELRAAAQHEHTQKIQKVNQEAKKNINIQLSSSHKCGCFPCSNLHP